MSEKEKIRRAKYRQNREKWIFAQTIIVIVVAIAVLISALVCRELTKDHFVTYREGGSIDYDVYLKDNEFYDTPALDKDQSYVASLIESVIANFSYQMDMDADNVNYRYSYTITSRLEIIDNTSKAPIFNPEYLLVSVEDKLQSSSKILSVNEIVVIDYDEYNNLANKFLSTYNLTSTTSNIVVTLKVNVLGDCTAFAGSAAETYVSELRIPLTTKTVNVKMTSAADATESKTVALAGGAGSEVFKTTAIVLGVLDAILLAVLVAFIYLTRTEDITYTARVKKIVSQYKSYIQKINNVFDTRAYQIVCVDTFDEMLEIRDTIQAPILMHENAQKTCAKFMIPTDSKLLYRYEIKIEGFNDPEPEAMPEAPTTVVNPHITNIVRPVVKVTLAPKAEEPAPEVETLVEEPEIEVEEDAQAPEVEVVIEEEEHLEEAAPEIEEEPIEGEIAEENEESDDILESIPMLEIEDEEDLIVEAPGVDAIDVVWQERKDKKYRYDPDGNTVEEGDVVLVPTRDVSSDREVVREAEVARGNYKVDPLELDSPLKKIIGVVRRRAEKVFVAMIEPDESSKDSIEK